MKKIVVIFIILIIIAAALMYFNSRSQTTKSPVLNNQPTITTSVNKITDKLKVYEDNSGFKFDYPENLTVNTLKITDENIYTLLEIKSKDIPGLITIKIVSSTLTKIDDYFKNKKNLITKKIKIAELDARQFTENNVLNTVALDKGVLISISTDYKQNKDYWTEVNAKIIATFAFINPENTSNGNSSSSTNNGDITVEEEEIVE